MNYSKLILGTVQFGIDYGINNNNGMPSKKEIRDILNYAFMKGIRFLDTAEAYGDSHLRIGEYHNSSENRFNIITKFFAKDDTNFSNIYEKVMNNITEMNVDKLYGYMFHSFGDYKKYYRFFKKDLNILKKKKKINKIGVSIYSNYELEQVLNDDTINLIQLPFNLLDNSNKREKILLKAKNLNVEIHTRSVFLQGLFFKNLNSIPKNLNELKPYLVKLNSLTPRINELALSYVYSKNYIDQILIGVDNVGQLKSNISSLKNYKTNDFFNKIDKINVKNHLLLNPSNWKL